VVSICQLTSALTYGRCYGTPLAHNVPCQWCDVRCLGMSAAFAFVNLIGAAQEDGAKDRNRVFR
jgi:hypothetical protein